MNEEGGPPVAEDDTNSAGRRDSLVGNTGFYDELGAEIERLMMMDKPEFVSAQSEKQLCTCSSAPQDACGNPSCAFRRVICHHTNRGHK